MKRGVSLPRYDGAYCLCRLLGVFKGGETGAWEDMHRFTTPRLAVNVKVRVPSPFGVLCYWKEINTFHTGRSEGH